MLVPILMIVGGLALAAWTAWQHRGRTPASRAWSRSIQGSWSRRAVLVVRPLIAAVLVLGGLSVLLADTAVAVPFGLATGVCLLVLFAYIVLPLPIPSAVQPQWFRESGGRRGLAD